MLSVGQLALVQIRISSKNVHKEKHSIYIRYKVFVKVIPPKAYLLEEVGFIISIYSWVIEYMELVRYGD